MVTQQKVDTLIHAYKCRRGIKEWVLIVRGDNQLPKSVRKGVP